MLFVFSDSFCPNKDAKSASEIPAKQAIYIFILNCFSVFSNAHACAHGYFAAENVWQKCTLSNRYSRQLFATHAWYMIYLFDFLSNLHIILQYCFNKENYITRCCMSQNVRMRYRMFPLLPQLLVVKQSLSNYLV